MVRFRRSDSTAAVSLTRATTSEAHGLYTIYVEYNGGWCIVRDFSRFQTYSLPRFKLISPLLLKHHDYLSVKTLPQVKVSRTTMLKHQRVTT